jgi:teichuronic acid biosynthesis glycosyltransferase TuaC
VKILFVTQETDKRPSGVKTVINNLCKEWNNDDELIILINKRYEAQESLVFGVNKKVKIKRVPFLLPSEIISYLNLSDYSIIIRLLIKVFYRILLLLYSFITIPCFSYWLVKNEINTIINHNGGWPAGELNRWIAISGKLACVKNNFLVLHSMPVTYKLFNKYFLILRDRFIELCCNKIITVSNACQIAIKNETGFKAEPHVIYNGIPLDKPKTNDILPPWDKKHLSIAFFGGLQHLKGIHILIDSLQYIETPCELVLVGNGDEKYVEYLNKLSQKSKWKVHFVGFRKDALSLYRWVDVVALVSIQFESFGISLLEGMLWEKALVCSDFGGMREIVIAEENGLISSANNAHALAVSLDLILSNEKLRTDMGEKGRKRLEDFFTAKQMYDNYKALINKDILVF